MTHRSLLTLALAVCLVAPLQAQVLTQADIEYGLANDDPSGTFLTQLRTMGLVIFSKPLTLEDGHGDGPYDPYEIDKVAFGHRPTAQGNGQFLRFNGLDAQACNECHVFVKHSTVPPTLGIAGVGGAVMNAAPAVSLFDIADSADLRVSYVPGYDPDLPLVEDGVADYNGRFINPPFLFGGGGVELLSKEITRDLQALLAYARTQPCGTEVALTTHGVDFGSITSLGGGEVELDLVGIGLHGEHLTDEEQLVMRAFGRKGENFSMRDFDRGAMQFHFGIQPVEVVGAGVDEDKDGVVDELTIAEMSTLHIFDVMNPRPQMDNLDQMARRGFDWFQAIDCASCHRPALVTDGRKLPLAFPEDPTDPWANVYVEIDLHKIGFDAAGQGVKVPLFADLKRHDMGEGLAETCERCLEISNSEFTTARLWGIADTEPYLHDGRALSLMDAILMHGGEAEVVRDRFEYDLTPTQQQELLYFLGHLRTPDNPNEELTP